MKIGLDFDNTYTCDPEEFEQWNHALNTADHQLDNLLNQHLRTLLKTFVIVIISCLAIWLLSSFGAWFSLTAASAIVFYGVYRLCLDED